MCISGSRNRLPPTQLGLLSLVFAIVGITACALTAPVAVGLARDVRRRVPRSHEQAKLAQAGLILGWIGVGLLVFQATMMIAWTGLMFSFCG